MTLDDLRRPWQAVDTNHREQIGQELAKETGPSHPLRGKSVEAIARRCDCDDVLFQIVKGTPHYAVVHLVWSGKEECDPRWPETELFNSLEEWKEKRMIPDCEDYNA